MDAEKIGLEESEVRPVVDQLNDLLANYHIHYQKLRGCHWNVKGPNFFTLHTKFEELYNEAQTTIDELAERILTLGKSPVSTFSEYIQRSRVREVNTINMSDTDMVEAIINDMTILLEIERELMESSASAADEGTNGMISGFIHFQEKTIWMLRSFTGK